jgi:hypothetical protein
MIWGGAAHQRKGYAHAQTGRGGSEGQVGRHIGAQAYSSSLLAQNLWLLSPYKALPLSGLPQTWLACPFCMSVQLRTC